MAELTRSAYGAYIDEKIAAAIILTRAAVETAAAQWYLRTKIDKAIVENNLGNIDKLLMQLLAGSRVDPKMPESVNVLTFVDYVEREILGFRKQYDEMSKYAHPNWSGTLLLFSEPDTKNIWTNFGPNLRSEASKQVGTINLEVSLVLFEHTYTKISEAMPDFIKISEGALA